MNGHVHHAVAVLLAGELLGVTGSAPHVSLSAESAYLDDYGRRARGRKAYANCEGALLAIEALGLFTPSETAEWRQRFEVAGHGWSVGPEADAAQRVLAEQHLESLTGSLGAATDTGTRKALLDRLNAAFRLYLQTGLVRPEDASTCGERVEQAVGQTVEEFELELAGIDPEELDEPGGGEPRSIGAVLRVVAAEPARHDGLCVTAVVLHEQGFELQWHELRESSFEPDDRFETSGFEVADDIGTEYPTIHSGGASWSERKGVFAVLGQSTCTTPVPHGASELRIARGPAQWLIPLG
jgi:hypothetical protein